VENWWALALPVLTALVGGGVGAVLTRKSSRETNVTNAFNVVVTQLLSVNDSLRKDVEQLKREVGDLTNKYNTSESEVRNLTDRVDELTEANRTLARQLSLLVASWPAGTAMPPISDDWRTYLD
jgi:uncharacterized protein YlxW (UPF0749 family)